MRQDIEFTPGEAVSQRSIARLLAQHFDALVTIDPHLHRIASLDEVMPPPCRGVALSAARLLGDFIAAQHAHDQLPPLLLGPDEESAQWVAEAAGPHGLPHAWCVKARHGDRDVRVTLPDGLELHGRAVVLIDDMASTGRTLIAAARLCFAAGADTVDVAVAHALFVGDAMDALHAAGVRRVWSSDCVPHASNAVSVVGLLAGALRGL
jgi:ribose-phosphate pyrophosphokinase